MSIVVGRGSYERPLSNGEIREICAAALFDFPLDGKRVLVLIPDHTRHAQIGLFFRLIYDLLGERTAALDYLVATGTHAPMSLERIYRHLEITREEHQGKFARARFFNHEHNNTQELVTLGSLTPSSNDAW